MLLIVELLFTPLALDWIGVLIFDFSWLDELALYLSIQDLGVMEGLGMLGSAGMREVLVDVISDGLIE